MKKILCIVVLAAGIFTCTSCSKSCTCKTYYNGELKSENSFELDEDKKCSDYESFVSVLGQEVSVKCNAKLF